jgi:hypothetical protein
MAATNPCPLCLTPSIFGRHTLITSCRAPIVVVSTFDAEAIRLGQFGDAHARSFSASNGATVDGSQFSPRTLAAMQQLGWISSVL